MDNWNYVPFKEGTWGNVKIHSKGKSQFLSVTDEDNYVWQGTGPSYTWGILSQRQMFYKAKGKVLTTLGLGLMPLLLATKEDVTEVVCYEIRQDIIDAWDAQDFDKSKITVVHGDLMDIDDISSYDSIAIDCHPIVLEFRNKWHKELKDHNYIFQSWDDFYLHWLGTAHDGVHSMEALDEFCDLVPMERITKEEADLQLFTYYSKSHHMRKHDLLDTDIDWPIDETLNQQLLKIRKTNG